MFSKIQELAVEAGRIILEATSIEEAASEKSSNSDIVTEYDVRVQNFLIENLMALCPDAYFLGEENSSGGDEGKLYSGKAFVIDPIDGTTNFVRGFKKSSVSIAYVEDGEVVYGCCYMPYCDELFTAQKGKGAYLNGKRITASDRSIEHAVVAVGTTPYEKNKSRATFEIMRIMFESSMDVRRFGSAVIDLTDVACGRTDLYCELGLSPWDHAAGAFIAREAGAMVSTMNGSELPLDRRCSVLVGNSKCYEFFRNSEQVLKYKDLF